MEEIKDKKVYWNICKNCKGHGKIKKNVRKKTRLDYKKALDQFEKSNCEGTAPIRPIRSTQHMLYIVKEWNNSF